VSLLQFLRILFARRIIIFAAAGSCFAVAMFVAQLIPPRYDATARIMLDLVKPDPVTGEVMASKSLTTYANTQIQLIKDYQTAGVVVDRLGWASNPDLIAQYNASGATQEMDIRRWLAQRIMDGTDAALLFGSNIMTITFSAPSSDGARQIVDLVRAAYLDEALRRRREEASKNADWYNEQTDRALQALTTAEANRTAFARANGIVLQSDNRTDLETAKLEALSGQSALAGAGGGAVVAPPAAPSMQLDQINQQIAQAAGTLGPNHPTYQALLRQRQVLQANLARQEALARGMGAGRVSVEAIDRAFQIQKSRVMSERDKLDKLAQLQREIDLRRDQYFKSAQRLAELRLEANGAGTGMSALGDASGSAKPSFPKMPLVAGGSLALGLGLGLFVALLTELLARRVRGEDDLEYATGAPVFATITERKPDGWLRRFVKKIGQGRSRRNAAELAEA
jgi:uncharacterized protein involved in exopolysaccharide biosynthesis